MTHKRNPPGLRPFARNPIRLETLLLSAVAFSLEGIFQFVLQSSSSSEEEKATDEASAEKPTMRKKGFR